MAPRMAEPGLTADQLRQTIEALLQVESQLPPRDRQWSELRVVRNILTRMLLITEEKERGEEQGKESVLKP